jgi:hypothetical protein
MKLGFWSQNEKINKPKKISKSNPRTQGIPSISS